MDRHLLAREQLLVRLSEIRARKIAERDEGMASRNTQINTIDGYIVGIGADLSKKDNVARMIDLKRRLQMQVGILKKKYVSTTYDDGCSTVGLTPLPLFGSYCRLKVPVYGDFILDQALHIRMSALWTTHKESRALVRLPRAPHHQGARTAETLRWGGNPHRHRRHLHIGSTEEDGLRPQVHLRLQSPKREHLDTDLYILLLYWFNLDPAFVLSN
ncbi:hypothetical protein PR003_g21530 [Phytophthora rubi]|uniref:Uncharacterized protein n=1 Tax=Phytophthora rubi TaxID=129364 RepID=A0A6A4DBC7_9STRA|nr:hypothetical protein PR002_g21308 [Phytophthora rubi]KAE8993463.1 hypothetical protein PR001_g20664 [Phytophthora rubi]KAE9305311.1 hypothetical protein PR003_g21530 [Phytophthora rubi]